jgi:hypothetical protein
MNRARAFLAGAGAAYLLDPAHGKRRRRVARDRGLRTLRRVGRLAGKKSRFALGHLRGLVARTRHVVLPRRVATDDWTVEQRIRSDALREAGVTAKDVDVHVRRGVVTLRGEVGGRTVADDLIARVRKVPGVVDVAAMLHVSPIEEAAA